MKTEIKRITFFSKEEYEKIKKENNLILDRWACKKLFEDYNKEICEQVLENKDGYILPFDLGQLIVEKYMPYNGYDEFLKEKGIYNYHSFEYKYKIKWYKSFRKRRDKQGNLNRVRNGANKVNKKILRFFPHRANLFRKLAKIVKTQEQDYQNIV